MSPAVFFLVIVASRLSALAADPAGQISRLLCADLPPLSGQGQDPAIKPQDPGEGVDYIPWSDWTKGEKFTPLSRININLAFGGTSLTDGPPSQYWSGGPALSMEAGYAFAPFLAVSGNFDYFLMSGDENIADYAGNTYNVDTDEFTVMTVGLEAKVRLPFNLIGPNLFRFSKAREGLGLVPFAKLGFGLARVSAGELDYEQWGVPGYTHHKVWNSYTGYYYEAGLGVELRWKYFGLGFSYSSVFVRAPTIIWGGDFLNIEPKRIMSNAFYSLECGVYF